MVGNKEGFLFTLFENQYRRHELLPKYWQTLGHIHSLSGHLLEFLLLLSFMIQVKRGQRVAGLGCKVTNPTMAIMLMNFN